MKTHHNIGQTRTSQEKKKYGLLGGDHITFLLFFYFKQLLAVEEEQIRRTATAC